jgi:hypothetical protein
MELKSGSQSSLDHLLVPLVLLLTRDCYSSPIIVLLFLLLLLFFLLIFPIAFILFLLLLLFWHGVAFFV